MDLGLNGARALVCASTSGLGLAIATALAAEGAVVAVNGRREAEVSALAAELDGVGLPGDLTEAGFAGALAEQAVAALGGVDILVLNSGGPQPSTATDLGTAGAQAALELLVLPQVALLDALLPGMRTAGWGRVVAVGSSGIVEPLASLAGSNLGRAALAAHLKTLASEVAGDGVTCNVVLPGRIDTARVAAIDAAAAARRGTSAAEVRRGSEAGIPAGRYGTPEEFAAAAVFLCSRQAGYITGSRLRVDGGMLRSS